MKSAVKKFLARVDLKIAHDRSDTWSPTLDLIGLVANTLFGQQDTMSILQIGANDGITNDPFAAFVERHNTRAVLIEPQPQPFASLRERYKDDPDVKCRQAALARADGSTTLHYAHFDDKW